MKVLPKLLLLCSLFFTPFLVTAGPVDINSADAKAIAAATVVKHHNAKDHAKNK